MSAPSKLSSEEREALRQARAAKAETRCPLCGAEDEHHQVGEMLQCVRCRERFEPQSQRLAEALRRA